jgi:hypothetical protein
VLDLGAAHTPADMERDVLDVAQDPDGAELGVLRASIGGSLA